jgi:N-acetylmuramic acid 6-phosphate etherase
MVIGIIAGGDRAIRFPVEGAEDNREQGWLDVMDFHPGPLDTLIGIAASGRTPYVIGALEEAKKNGLLTGCITCNENSPVTQIAEYAIVPVVGPEVITGSTRMKSGTAQKLALNMISTSVMVGLGRVKGNKMVDMQLTNEKLVLRGTQMVMDQTGLDSHEAMQWLLKYGSVRNAVMAYQDQHA